MPSIRMMVVEGWEIMSYEQSRVRRSCDGAGKDKD